MHNDIPYWCRQIFTASLLWFQIELSLRIPSNLFFHFFHHCEETFLALVTRCPFVDAFMRICFIFVCLFWETIGGCDSLWILSGVIAMNPAIKLLPEEHHERENFYMNRKKNIWLLPVVYGNDIKLLKLGIFFQKFWTIWGCFQLWKTSCFSFFRDCEIKRILSKTYLASLKDFAFLKL